MTAVIVLGPHRSGTSLVAGILNTLGVSMGEHFRTGDEFNPTGYWEDEDFKALNKSILKMAGGTWHEPPAMHDVYDAGLLLESEIFALLRKRAHLFGWKDPRQCLTMVCYEHWLHVLHGGVTFVVVERNVRDIVASLMAREQAKGRRTDRSAAYWTLLTEFYYSRIDNITAGHYTTHVQYELLTFKYKARSVLADLCRSIGVFPDDVRLERAMDMIMFKEIDGS